MRRITMIVVGWVILIASSPDAARKSAAGLHAQEIRLQRLVGRWYILTSTFGGPPDSTVPTFVATSTAMGRAVYSTWKQGSGASAYEANALWAYDSVSGQVRVFEANSVGVAETHIGRFDNSDALTLEQRVAPSGEIAQRRVFRWSRDTLRMTATFVAGGRTTNHNVTMVRRVRPS